MVTVDASDLGATQYREAATFHPERLCCARVKSGRSPVAAPAVSKKSNDFSTARDYDQVNDRAR
jgi:hypothetical protein